MPSEAGTTDVADINGGGCAGGGNGGVLSEGMPPTNNHETVIATSSVVDVHRGQDQRVKSSRDALFGIVTCRGDHRRFAVIDRQRFRNDGREVEPQITPGYELQERPR